MADSSFAVANLSADHRSYSVLEAAEKLGLHEETVRRWIREGRLYAERVPGHGRGTYLIPARELDRLRGGPQRPPLEQRALGKYLLRRGDLKAARTCYEAAFAASRELRDPLGQAKSLYKLGQISQREGRFDEAETHFSEASALFTEVSYRKGEDAARLALADLVLARNRPEAPAADLAQAKGRYLQTLESGDARGRAVGERGLGEIALEEGHLDEAGTRLGESYRLATILEDPLMQAEALRSLARYFTARREPHEALLRLESAARIFHDYGLAEPEAAVRDEIGNVRLELFDSQAAAPKPTKGKKRVRA